MQSSFVPVCSCKSMYMRLWNQASAYPLHITLYFFGTRDPQLLELARQWWSTTSAMPYRLPIRGIDILSYTSFGTAWGMDVLHTSPLERISLPGNGNKWQIVLRFYEGDDMQRLREDRARWLNMLQQHGYATGEQRPYKPHMKIGDISYATGDWVSTLCTVCRHTCEMAAQKRLALRFDIDDVLPVGRALGMCALRGDHVREHNREEATWIQGCVRQLRDICQQ